MDDTRGHEQKYLQEKKVCHFGAKKKFLIFGKSSSSQIQMDLEIVNFGSWTFDVVFILCLDFESINWTNKNMF